MTASTEQERASLSAFIEMAEREGFDTAHQWYEAKGWVFFSPSTADCWRYWQAARRAPAAPVPQKQLEWSDPAPPCEACRYDHVKAQSPFGEFRIEWKSWKKHGDDYCIYLNGDFLKAEFDLCDAKEYVQQHMAEMAEKLAPYAAAPQPPEAAQASVSNGTLAAPVELPEPAAITTSHDGEFFWFNHLASQGSRFGARLYTEQQVRQLLAARLKPLTDEQWTKIWADWFDSAQDAEDLIRSIEKAHGITQENQG